MGLFTNYVENPRSAALIRTRTYSVANHERERGIRSTLAVLTARQKLSNRVATCTWTSSHANGGQDTQVLKGMGLSKGARG